MRVLSLARTASPDGVARIAVVLTADEGARHCLTVEGRQLHDHPVTFARLLGAESGRPALRVGRRPQAASKPTRGADGARRTRPEPPQTNAAFSARVLDRTAEAALLASRGSRAGDDGVEAEGGAGADARAGAGADVRRVGPAAGGRGGAAAPSAAVAVPAAHAARAGHPATGPSPSLTYAPPQRQQLHSLVVVGSVHAVRQDDVLPSAPLP